MNAFSEAWSLLKELDSDQRDLLGRIRIRVNLEVMMMM